MRKYYVILLFLAFGILNINAQLTDKNCYYGITFEFSQNPNWGYGELVITDVEPNSPAERAGFRVNDIIMEINGQATFLRDNATIARWLFDVYDPTVKFTIRNQSTSFQEYTLTRNCINTNAISEQQLSEFFSFYSLEDTNSQTFTLPVKITPHDNADYTYFHTYDFYTEPGQSIPAIDTYITNLVSMELQSKGMVRDTQNPDILIQTYYSFSPNAKYSAAATDSVAPAYRFDKDHGKMVAIPALNASDESAEKRCKYIVEFGISFYDKKIIDTEKMTQVWDCNIQELLAEKYPLEEYVRIMTPLILMQFPYSTGKTSSKYEVKFNRYNYTGMYFNTDNLVTIQDVIPGSPAYRVGIRAGYKIQKLNNKKFDHTKESLSDGYKKFITETMLYRDPSVRFTISSGYNDCMFWDKKSYDAIAKELAKPAYQAHFAYLYGFEKYIYNKPMTDVKIEAWDGIQLRLFSVTPEIRKSTTIRIKD
ncbi:PDZ domain-containing protein [Dysgonomonas sp. 25]|uniref:PDZ domain-containing protein n=1 Tax=Dysgonomonas sp. 25 TaxID=2302933 RepID=UPI0013D4EF0B|nr:PDZ domain-containing protein [Dysgonomonas sp. 25]NDV69635.1 PDZ domain-containing protein [Dysgonomonas sp. 25]